MYSDVRVDAIEAAEDVAKDLADAGVADLDRVHDGVGLQDADRHAVGGGPGGKRPRRCGLLRPR